MASLDDFFAKKDKSKKKSKVKSADTEESKTKKVSKKKDKENKISSTTGTTNKSTPSGIQEDEDWNDFEEEKAVDYSGLRIQNLQIAKEEQDRDAADGEEDEYDEDGEMKERKDGSSGPWNKSTHSVGTPAPVEKPKPKPTVEQPAVKIPGKYVPPAQRQAVSNPSFPSSRRKKEAPNLQSEVDFPTLGGNQTYSQSGTSDTIENPNHRKGVNLHLENKFQALQD